MCPFETMLAEPCLEYDFVESRTHDGRAFRMLIVINEFSQERMLATGLGVLQPIASNDTLAGRRANRRVEVELRAQLPMVSAKE